METTTKTIEALEPSVSEAIAWLEKQYPRGVDLVYIDYRDSIEDAEKREAIIQKPEEAWEIIDAESWVFDCQIDTKDYILREFAESREEGGTYDITEEVREAMDEWMSEHDTSEPVKDLLKNTRDEYMYYDTGLYFDSLDYAGDKEKEITRRSKLIAKKLKVDYAKNESALRLMVGQAWYGGQLVILFEANIAEFMQDAKYISFSGSAEVCLMDRGQGSGDSVKLGEKMLFEFVRENLHTDKGDSGYSYAYDVCGLVSGIMEDGVLTNKPKGKRAIRVKTNEARQAEREREERYIASWKAGKCSAGDMNIKRHKSAPYRNDYPCGNKCEECGTFWID